MEILRLIEAAIDRAEEEIQMLCGGKPDEDTKKVLEDVADASRMMMALRHHLETANPWQALAQIVDCKDSIWVKLALEAHERFQVR